MKKLLQSLFEYKTLSKLQAKEALHNLTAGKFNDCEMAAFLTIYCMRPITVDELSGFREALHELCISVDLGTNDAIDMCGTGGDGKHTFNISTLASFVIAGAGIKVAKHGNYGVSSGCGSSNVLESLGYKFTSNVDELKATLQKSNICFMHAPLFHPAMKNIAPIRKALGVKTFFNMLGPIINPSFPQKQVTGVYNKEVARLYKYVLQQSTQEFIILHSFDGYDEISLTSPFLMITKNGEQIIKPEDIGFPTYKQSDIAGGDTIPESKKIFMEVLECKATQAQTDVVIANAAVGIHCAKPSQNLKECIEEADEALRSKKALDALNLFLH